MTFCMDISSSGKPPNVHSRSLISSPRNDRIEKSAECGICLAAQSLSRRSRATAPRNSTSKGPV
eukprot:scaffold49383_cov27-Tisochrysis_lutea.AAC.14